MLTTHAADAIVTRHVAVAGRFYPAGAAHLRAVVDGYLRAAQPAAAGDVRAVIAPHAGYTCSGGVAGRAFAPLRALPDAQYTVFVVGPAHWVPIRGIALSGAAFYATPLGVIPVNQQACADLAAHGPLFRVDDAAHAPEHALEVELPFLQATLAYFSVVPILCQDVHVARDLCAALSVVLATYAPALVVVSSDLSHAHPYRKACARDGAFLHDVVTGDVDAARHGEACGLPGVLALMMLAAQQGWTARLLAYANSGDTCSDRRAVVGYGAVVYDA